MRERSGRRRSGRRWREPARRRRRDLRPGGKNPGCSIRIRSRITLYLGSGAEIVFKDDPAEYGTLSELAGTKDPANCMHCVYAWREEYVSVKGDGVLYDHGELVIGSEMSGDVRNVTVSNFVFQDTDRGIRMKTRQPIPWMRERRAFGISASAT